MSGFDLIAALLERERAGTPERQRDATRELLQQATDHLGDSGSIPDMRLRRWLVDYLGQQVAALPQQGRGRPSNIGEQLNIAIRVELARLPASDDDPLDAVRGQSLVDAVDYVAANSRFTQSTVKRHHENLRADALSILKRHGRRLPA